MSMAAKVEQDRVSPPPFKKRKIQSTTTANGVASFFTAVSQKAPERTTWREIDDTLLVARYGDHMPVGEKACRIAAFDLDGTIITTASGKSFARDSSDWKFWDHCIPERLRRLHEEGYRLLLLSNQSGLNLKTDPKTVKTDKKRTIDFKQKITAVLHRLDLPISLYAATTQDRYRKPRTGMWEEFLEDHDLEGDLNNVDLAQSFFIGDAAGRLADGKKSKADFSSSDRDFADNVGLKFETPEEYFLQERARPFKRNFDPKSYLLTRVDSVLKTSTFVKLSKQEVVLFVGLPASGKSTFYFSSMKSLGYERINQDTLKTRERCLKKCAELIADGRSVAVDNTNIDRATRAHWVQLAKSLGVPIRCVNFSASPELCRHNDAVRALNKGSWNPEQRVRLPHNLAFSFASRYEEPVMEEGFQSITEMQFEFKGDADVWTKFWA
ncbi:MAG: hypothetical protein M1828_004204 [Chrysothrix sp. TS-e1954]|nr:MAG: hypothetical protein M1828_004204 [Chrysothrix sp. TS-e1954]